MTRSYKEVLVVYTGRVYVKLCSETQVLLTPYTFQPLHHSGSDSQAAKTFGPGVAVTGLHTAQVYEVINCADCVAIHADVCSVLHHDRSHDFELLF